MTDVLRDALADILECCNEEWHVRTDSSRIDEIRGFARRALSLTEGAAPLTKAERLASAESKSEYKRLAATVPDDAAAQPVPEGVSRLTDWHAAGLDYALAVALDPQPEDSPEWTMTDIAKAFATGARAALAIQGVGRETEQPLGNQAQALPGERCGGPAGETER